MPCQCCWLFHPAGIRGRLIRVFRYGALLSEAEIDSLVLYLMSLNE